MRCYPSFCVFPLQKIVSILGLFLAITSVTFANSDPWLDTLAGTPGLRLFTDADTRAYRGQLIQLALAIHVPQPLLGRQSLITLNIPWLGREFGFRWRLPLDQWLCTYRIAKPGHLACRIDIPDELARVLGVMEKQVRIYIPPDPAVTNTWKLTWQIILDKPIFGNNISFAAVSMQIPGLDQPLYSKPLSLVVEETPPPLGLQPACMLPPGTYTISAACQPDVAYVGETIEYTLCISGSGALEDLDWREVHRMLTRDLRLAVHFQGETWHDNRTRCLRWRLQLTSAGLWQLLPLRFLAFNPLDADPRYRELLTPPELIRVLPAVPPPPPEWAPDMPRLHIQSVAHLLPPTSPSMAIPWTAIILWLGPPALWSMLAIWTHLRGKPLTWRRYSVPARKLFSMLKTQRHPGASSGYTIWHALQQYLHERCGTDLGTTAQQIAASLSHLPLEAGFTREFGELLQRIEKAAFSPDTVLNHADIQRLTETLAELEYRLDQLAGLRR